MSQKNHGPAQTTDSNIHNWCRTLRTSLSLTYIKRGRPWLAAPTRKPQHALRISRTDFCTGISFWGVVRNNLHLTSLCNLCKPRPCAPRQRLCWKYLGNDSPVFMLGSHPRAIVVTYREHTRHIGEHSLLPVCMLGRATNPNSDSHDPQPPVALAHTKAAMASLAKTETKTTICKMLDLSLRS